MATFQEWFNALDPKTCNSVVVLHRGGAGPLKRRVVGTMRMPDGTNKGYVYGLVFSDSLHHLPSWFNEFGKGHLPLPVCLKSPTKEFE